MNLSMIKPFVTGTIGRGGLILGKHSPTILTVVGVVGVVTSAVFACKATLKLEDVINEAEEKMKNIKEADETFEDEKYSPEDAKKDKLVVIVQTTVNIMKLYGPSVILGVVSIGCIVKGYGILQKRNMALVAAYKAIDEGFTAYRKRVVEEFGSEKDVMLKRNIRQNKVDVEITETDENGNVIQASKSTINIEDPTTTSQYARFFDECSLQWSKTPEYNLVFLRCQQNYANDMLRSRGHIFLNEVYDMLGIPRSQAGAVVGWVKGQGDSFVDFGIFEGSSSATRAFVNGYEPSILLDFNVAGVIYDMIGE